MKKDRKFLVSSTDETSLCALYRFDAVITQALDCFLDVSGDVDAPTKTHRNDYDIDPEVADVVAYKKI